MQDHITQPADFVRSFFAHEHWATHEYENWKRSISILGVRLEYMINYNFMMEIPYTPKYTQNFLENAL